MIDYLDSNVVIYLVERHPIWGPKAERRVAALRSAGDEVALSDAHRLECLVGPLILGDTAALTDYQAFFSDPAVKVLSLTAAAWERAARIRAVHGFRPLDSLHLAAAVEHGCGIFLTNDVQLSRFPDITIEILS